MPYEISQIWTKHSFCSYFIRPRYKTKEKEADEI